MLPLSRYVPSTTKPLSLLKFSDQLSTVSVMQPQGKWKYDGRLFQSIVLVLPCRNFRSSRKAEFRTEDRSYPLEVGTGCATNRSLHLSQHQCARSGVCPQTAYGKLRLSRILIRCNLKNFKPSSQHRKGDKNSNTEAFSLLHLAMKKQFLQCVSTAGAFRILFERGYICFRYRTIQ